MNAYKVKYRSAEFEDCVVLGESTGDAINSIPVEIIEGKKVRKAIKSVKFIGVVQENEAPPVDFNRDPHQASDHKKKDAAEELVTKVHLPDSANDDLENLLSRLKAAAIESTEIVEALERLELTFHRKGYKISNAALHAGHVLHCLSDEEKAGLDKACSWIRNYFDRLKKQSEAFDRIPKEDRVTLGLEKEAD